jgi:DNA mismatch repair protein MutS2
LPEAIVADARGRLTENQQAFESTLASIREQEGEIAGAVERARLAEVRAAESMRAADEERRRARRERDEAVRAARDEAERLVESLREDVAGIRRRLERETVTAPVIDDAVSRAERTLDRLPASGRPPERPVPAEPHAWHLGDRARSRSGGWEGRIAALEKGGTRATLEAGGMRVSVSVEDLEPAVGGGEGGNGGSGRGGSRSRSESSGIGALQLAKSRTVASSLDLRGARVDEALEALSRYLDDAALAGLEQVIVIHGLGTGALRDAVREQASANPLVKDLRAGERGEGGDGATIVRL